MATQPKENKAAFHSVNGKLKEPKKYVFLWTYKNPDKKTGTQSGEIESVSITTAKVALRQRGFNTRYLTIKKQKESMFGSIKMADIVAFLQQLATLQNAGVSIVESMQMLRLTSKKPTMRHMIQKMIRNLQEGNQLSDALALFPKYFDATSIALIKSGEQGGVLDTVLRNIAEYKEKDYKLKKKIKSALMYPGITVFVMIIVVIILMVKVIPVFAKLFKSFNAQLPELTQIVVNISYWIKDHVVFIVFIPALAIALLVWSYRRSYKVRWQIDRITLHLPVFGKLLLYGATARFMQTLALLYAAGVPIQESMNTLSKVSGNTVIDAGVEKARESVLAGGRIADGLKQTYLPDLAVRMLSIGESSGNVEIMAKKTGDHFAGEVEEMVARMSTLLEPFIMILLGGIVGTLVIAMFLPMLDMGQAIMHGTGS